MFPSKRDSSRREKNEFNMFMRYYCTRMVQSVVQARMGELIAHKCKTTTDTSDWFNLVIDEIGEIAAYLKSGIKKYPPLSDALTLDFLLHTADGDSLPLESWVVRVNKNTIDENVNVHTILYHQMSTMLKSIIMAARFTPAYRYYARKQSPDTFVIFYRVFEGEPDFSLLGEEQKHRRIGCLSSPFGSIQTDLYYRTKMEILPPPFVEEKVVECVYKNEQVEGNILFNLASIPFGGNAVPAKGSSTIAASPVIEDINSFSTSPLSQDLPFVESQGKTQFKLGRSSSSTDESDRATTRHPSGSSRSDANSPKASNSFPQRNARQFQIRNNSFPFASLLVLDSHSSSDQSKSQFLPKVPEDVAVGGLRSSNSDQVLNSMYERRDVIKKKRNFSLTCESTSLLSRPSVAHSAAPVAQNCPSSSNEEQQQLYLLCKQQSEENYDCDDKDFQSRKKVIFGCTVDEEENTESHSRTSPGDEKIYSRPGESNSNEIVDENDDDRHSCSSDGSYVKVMAAFNSSEDLGADLTEFAKEVRLAPDNLTSFSTEDANILSKQIEEFREKASVFDNFVTSLKEASVDEER